MAEIGSERNPFPERVTVELTNRCDLSCEMCPRGYGNMELGDMERDLFVQIINELSCHNVTLLPFWRGESFLHPEAVALIDFAERQLGGHIVLSTNGQHIKEAVAVAPLVRNLNVSVHNARSIECIKAVDYVRVHNQPKMAATCVRGEPGAKLMGTHLMRYVDEIRWYEEHTLGGHWGRVKNAITPADIHQKQIFCQRLNTDFVIGWDGRVYRCCYAWVHNLPEINVRDMSISDIWNGLERHELLKNYPDSVCTICDQWRGYGKSL